MFKKYSKEGGPHCSLRSEATVCAGARGMRPKGGVETACLLTCGGCLCSMSGPPSRSKEREVTERDGERGRLAKGEANRTPPVRVTRSKCEPVVPRAGLEPAPSCEARPST